MKPFLEGILVSKYTLTDGLMSAGFFEITPEYFLEQGFSQEQIDLFIYDENELGCKWLTNGDIFVKMYGDRYCESILTLQGIWKKTKAYYSYKVFYSRQCYNCDEEGPIAYKSNAYKQRKGVTKEYKRVVPKGLCHNRVLWDVFTFLYNQNEFIDEWELEYQYKERWMEDSDGNVVVVYTGDHWIPYKINIDENCTWHSYDGVRKTAEEIPGINMETIKKYLSTEFKSN